MFKKILNDAAKSNHLIKNPIKGYSELREPPRMIKFWTKDEVSRFLDYTRLDPFHDLYVTTLNTGMRLGEIHGLCWDKIDFENNHIIVSRCLGRSGLKETTKSHEDRFIPMNIKVKAILERLNRAKTSDSYVFCKSDGSHLDYNHVTERYFTKSQLELGLSKVIPLSRPSPYLCEPFYDEWWEYLYASKVTRS